MGSAMQLGSPVAKPSPISARFADATVAIGPDNACIVGRRRERERVLPGSVSEVVLTRFKLNIGNINHE
jgi:hypothetical protein